MYGKIFESMYDGTLVSRGPWQAVVTFQQLIVLANRDGVVDMTPEAISRRTSIPLDIITLGLEELMKPDPRSRTPDDEGRRITLLEAHRDWGWHIVNHEKYRQMRNAEERREYLRVKKTESRARRKEEDDKSRAVNNGQQVSRKVNRSTDAVCNMQKHKTLDRLSSIGDGRFAEFWSRYPRKISKHNARKAWLSLRPDDVLAQIIIDAISRQSTSAAWQKDGGKFIPHAATWLNARRWEDVLETEQPRRLAI